MALRLAAYVFALAAIAFTAWLTLAAGAQGIVLAVLGGTLAATPYVVVRAIEELKNEQGTQHTATGNAEPECESTTSPLRRPISRR